MTSPKHTAYQQVIATLIDLTNAARHEHHDTRDPVAFERFKILDEMLGKLQTQRAKLKPPPAS